MNDRISHDKPRGPSAFRAMKKVLDVRSTSYGAYRVLNLHRAGCCRIQCFCYTIHYVRMKLWSASPYKLTILYVLMCHKCTSSLETSNGCLNWGVNTSRNNKEPFGRKIAELKYQELHSHNVHKTFRVGEFLLFFNLPIFIWKTMEKLKHYSQAGLCVALVTD